MHSDSYSEGRLPVPRTSGYVCAVQICAKLNTHRDHIGPSEGHFVVGAVRSNRGLRRYHRLGAENKYPVSVEVRLARHRQ